MNSQTIDYTPRSTGQPEGTIATTNSCATELYCPKCQALFAMTEVLNLCRCGFPLLVKYDFDQVGRLLTPDKLKQRGASLWKYHELLPVEDDSNVVTLGEGGTPLLRSCASGQSLGLKNLLFKDESPNPTGSFKARGLSVAVSRAKELGLSRLIIPTAGNAGSALAAYGARANMKVCVVMPEGTPSTFSLHCQLHGAEVKVVPGSIKDCGAVVGEMVSGGDWFSVATLKEPYRIEGKKTLGLELAEQLGYTLPDVIVYPTGGGTGLIGMWKAFDEMEQLGWIDERRPRMVVVQADGCAPMVRAFAQGKQAADNWENPTTVSAGLRVPGAVGDFLILRAVYDSGGTAVSVSDAESLAWCRRLATQEGIFAAPEGGAAMAGVAKLTKSGWIEPEEQVVCFITGSGYKYLDILEKIDILVDDRTK